MIQNLIRQRMAGYIRQAELFGDMRSVWSKHVWWTREVIIAIANKLKSTDASVAKLLKNPIEMGDLFSHYYSDRTVRRIEDLFTTHLKMGGDIAIFARDGNMAQVETLTRQWYENADEIARFFASINPHYSEQEVRKMMYEHLRLTLLEVSSYLQGQYEQSIQTFDNIQGEAQEMADYFTKGLIAQFPDRFR